METKKKKRLRKANIIIVLAGLLLFLFLFHYYASTTFYGTIEIRELKQDNNDYLVVVEGDFGVKESRFDEKDKFNIRENEETRTGNMTDIWNDLSEGKSFHVLLETYDNRNDFSLERIYMD